MKKTFVIISLLLFNYNLVAQQTDNKYKIKIILSEFMNCIETKDSVKIYNLFHKGPVTWVGVYKEETQKELLKKDSTAKNFVVSDYKTWFRRVATPSPRREDFSNIEIMEDGSIASVTFDYSFWKDDKKKNFGKEFWHLVNENGEWKIASVIFSIELEVYKSEQQSETNAETAASALVRIMADELLKVTKIPGLSIAIRKKESIVFAEGFGYADVEKQIVVTPQTQFRAASVSKAITSIGLAKMYQDKMIDIDAPIEKYVPYFPSKKYIFTLKQLAGHTSGLPHYQVSDKTEDRFYSSVKDAVNVFSHQPLIGKPGEKYSYSTHGFTLLSAAMEEASGVRFLDYMQDKVFNKLGMKNTEPDLRQYRLMPNMTSLYEMDKSNDYREIKKEREMSAFWAGGGFVTSPTDLVNMTKSFTNGYFTNETLTILFKSQKLSSGDNTQIGLGWRLSYDAEGRRVYEHAGTNQGTRTVVTYFPDEDVAISVMTNTQWVSNIEATAHAMALPFLKKEPYQKPLLNGTYFINASLKAKEKDKIVGGKIEFSNNMGTIHLDNGDSYTLFSISGNIYALITNIGVYYMILQMTNENKLFGKAIKYTTMQKQKPDDAFLILNSK